ncbi:MAG: hypothetical protein KDC38_16830 [Planctomycetes bacterium]|nr:hypothetical protein [Planctomycetota bacterium]
MRRLVVCLASLFLIGGVVDAQDLEENYKKKLAKEFVKKVPWVDTLEKAQALSRKTGKPIFGYFSRSYAP